MMKLKLKVEGTERTFSIGEIVEILNNVGEEKMKTLKPSQPAGAQFKIGVRMNGTRVFYDVDTVVAAIEWYANKGKNT